MHLVLTTKELLQTLRRDSWDAFLEVVKSFCEKKNIDIPDMSARYIMGRGRSCHQRDHITIEHRYRFDIFIAAIDTQLQELNSRFSDQTMKLLNLSSTLEPKDAFKSFNVDSICSLVVKFYPEDFTDQERLLLKFQLQYYHLDVPNHPNLCNLSTISALCRGLVETEKSKIYYLIDRLLRLVLTLPVSTATTERAFSAMKLVKTRLRSKMDDEFLADSLVLYIEREIAETFSTDSIIDDFYSLKHRRVQL